MGTDKRLAADWPYDFSISVFGRFTYTLSAMYGHCWGFFFFFFLQCPYIADSVCVNSRTLDIGKDAAPGLIRTLRLGGRWFFGILFMVCLE